MVPDAQVRSGPVFSPRSVWVQGLAEHRKLQPEPQMTLGFSEMKSTSRIKMHSDFGDLNIADQKEQLT